MEAHKDDFLHDAPCARTAQSKEVPRGRGLSFAGTSNSKASGGAFELLLVL